MSQEILRVTDSTSREFLEIMLAAECFKAKRVIPKPKLFEADSPTAWDLHHDRLDALLTDWQRAQ